MDEQYLHFLKDLQKLSKEELVEFIGDYWIKLKSQSEAAMKDKESYMVEEFGRIKMTQVYLLKNLAIIKTRDK